jgi:prepilin-type N-terminal cleavage/methylation domain-containing protein
MVTRIAQQGFTLVAAARSPRQLLRRPRRGRTTSRRGLTLVEVTLVLALLVVIAAVSMPLLGRSFTRASLQGASDLLRAAWNRARIEAMETGESQIVRLEVRGNRYLSMTLTAFGSGEGEPPLVPDDAPREPSDILRLRENRLPDGVEFAAADIAPSAQLLATLGQTPEGVWSNPIIFRPDGTTTDASVLLANEEGLTIRVTLRGITGISAAGEVAREPLPPR